MSYDPKRYQAWLEEKDARIVSYRIALYILRKVEAGGGGGYFKRVFCLGGGVCSLD